MLRQYGWHLHLLYHSNYVKPPLRNAWLYSNVQLYHHSQEFDEDMYSWEQATFSKLTKMSAILKNVDLVDGKLINGDDDSMIVDARIERNIHKFKSLFRTFLGCPSVQQGLKKKTVSTGPFPKLCFSQPNEREAVKLDTLTKVCNFLNVSAQQRKAVRFTICPQVSQHQIWTETLDEVLKGLKSEVELLDHGVCGKRIRISEQIISSCQKFLADAANSLDPESTSWMRLAPAKRVKSSPSRTWGEILQMFTDLTKCLEKDAGLLYHLSKVEVMKEGLYQIKDVLVDKEIGYKEARHQESLVQKKLSKTLGHSSQCMFTLLLYYLYGSVRDLEVDVSGGLYKGNSKDTFCLCIGKILTSDDEKAVWVGVKQLDRVLSLLKFIWESAGMRGSLQLHGHLWCVGTNYKTLTYRGNSFLLHGITL